jgi:lambda family phage holin
MNNRIIFAIISGLMALSRSIYQGSGYKKFIPDIIGCALLSYWIDDWLSLLKIDSTYSAVGSLVIGLLGIGFIRYILTRFISTKLKG